VSQDATRLGYVFELEIGGELATLGWSSMPSATGARGSLRMGRLRLMWTSPRCERPYGPEKRPESISKYLSRRFPDDEDSRGPEHPRVRVAYFRDAVGDWWEQVANPEGDLGPAFPFVEA